MQNSIISWLGGKRLLRKEIIPIIPKHNVYCEVFGGAGWVLFGKSNEKKDWAIPKDGHYRYAEIYNDFNSELVNFWKYIKHHPDAFVAELNEYIISRELFTDFKNNHHDRTELERAVLFYYLLTMSYGSQSKSFVVKDDKSLPLRALDKVKQATERLKNVYVENLDFETLVTKYDSDTTFFYVDPPYYKRENFYKRDNVGSFDGHERLANVLKNIKGKFILSYNDETYIRELYSDFHIKEVNAPYSVSKKRIEVKELIVANYEI